MLKIKYYTSKTSQKKQSFIQEFKTEIIDCFLNEKEVQIWYLKRTNTFFQLFFVNKKTAYLFSTTNNNCFHLTQSKASTYSMKRNTPGPLNDRHFSMPCRAFMIFSHMSLPNMNLVCSVEFTYVGTPSSIIQKPLYHFANHKILRDYSVI